MARVPFGTYEICIDNGGSNNTSGSNRERKRKVLQGAAAISVLNAVSGSTPVTIDFTTSTPGVLTRGSVNGSTNSQCNTTATSATFPN